MSVAAFILKTFLSKSFLTVARYRKSKQMWALLAVLHCCIMASGYMYNIIRRPAYSVDSKNGLNYVKYGNKDQQFVAESHFAVGLYIAGVASMIAMIEAAGGVKSADAPRPPVGQTETSIWRYLVYALGLMTFGGCTSLLLSMYKMKSRWYPYTTFVSS